MGKPTMLEKRRTTGGFVSEPGASNSIGDIRAMNTPNTKAGTPRIVSTMSHVRTGRDFLIDKASVRVWSLISPRSYQHNGSE